MTFSFPSSYLFTSNAVIDGCLLEKLRNRRCLYLRVLINRRFGNAAFFRVQVSLKSCALPIITLYLSSSRIVRPLKKRLTAGQVQVLLQD